jgi:hypothetical protein
MKILQGVSASCKTCQFLGPKPLRFRAVIPEAADKVDFGDELSIYLMWIEGDAVLHVVDIATRFSATMYIVTNGAKYGQGVDGVWSALVDSWVAVYSGYPNKLRTDAGSVFTSPVGASARTWQTSKSKCRESSLITRLALVKKCTTLCAVFSKR